MTDPLVNTSRFTSEQITAALNSAADDVLGAVSDHDDEQISDAVNLMVNAAQHYLTHDHDLDAAIEANYGDDPATVRRRISGQA